MASCPCPATMMRKRPPIRSALHLANHIVTIPYIMAADRMEHEDMSAHEEPPKNIYFSEEFQKDCRLRQPGGRSGRNKAGRNKGCLAPLRALSSRQVESPRSPVMAPMTRSQPPGGMPTNAMAAYYRRRAAGGLASRSLR